MKIRELKSEIADGDLMQWRKARAVIDYIEKMIATGRRDNDELLLLMDDIIDLGGKRGADLE